jgi:hypothetical protein
LNILFFFSFEWKHPKSTLCSNFWLFFLLLYYTFLRNHKNTISHTKISPLIKTLTFFSSSFLNFSNITTKTTHTIAQQQQQQTPLTSTTKKKKKNYQHTHITQTEIKGTKRLERLGFLPLVLPPLPSLSLSLRGRDERNKWSSPRYFLFNLFSHVSTRVRSINQDVCV